MPKKLLPAAMLLWLGFVVCAIALGALRDLVLVPNLGALARPIETQALCGLIFCLTIPLVRRHPEVSTAELWRLGGLWTALTLTFEFLAGHYLMGAPWETLLADWNLAAGHLWPLVPATILVSPVLARNLAARKNGIPTRPKTQRAR